LVKARTSFFEKKEAKKLSLLRAPATHAPNPTVNESFLLLFFKKEALASFLLSRPRPWLSGKPCQIRRIVSGDVMRPTIIAYITTLVVMGVLDGAWISFALNKIYKPGIGHLMTANPVVPAAVAFYLLYAAGVTYLIVLPATGAGSALVRGGVLGLIAYGTYDLTSLAIMNGWPAYVTIADMIWGTILTGVTAALATLAVQKFG